MTLLVPTRTTRTIQTLVRICNIMNAPLATNPATARLLMSEGQV